MDTFVRIIIILFVFLSMLLVIFAGIRRYDNEVEMMNEIMNNCKQTGYVSVRGTSFEKIYDCSNIDINKLKE